MKKRLLFLALLLLVSVAAPFAQNNSSFAQSTTDHINNTKPANTNPLLDTRSEIRLGVGVPFAYDVKNVPEYDYLKNDLSYSLEYTYRLIGNFELGASLSYRPISYKDNYYDDYYGGYYDYDNYYPEPPTYNDRTNLYDLSFAIVGRYSWFNRSWISLYSALGVYISTGQDYNENNYYDDYYDYDYGYDYGYDDYYYDDYYYDDDTNFNLSITPIGLRLGGKFFGFAEVVCILDRGIGGNFGLGFRF